MYSGRFPLTYCTNVHPGERLDEIYDVLKRDVVAVRNALGLETFGLGLRLGHSVVAELLGQPQSKNKLVDMCRRQNYSVFTVNGFPYGNFDSGRVKETVYDPDWTQPERLNYTLDIARLMASLPGPSERTISTVSGGFKTNTSSKDVQKAVANQLRTAAMELSKIADQTGIRIRLCLEPEPWTTLETTDDVLRFWEQEFGDGRQDINEHLGICYDVCHQAVHFEDPAASMSALTAAGIHIGKIQISSALALKVPQSAVGRQRLLAFAEPRFLHQVVAKTKTGLLRCLDLDALSTPSDGWQHAEEWRCHFHVPIWWEGDDVLSTTKAQWMAALAYADTLDYTPHLEIETYTWDVLPEKERKHMESGDLTRSIVAEFEAVSAFLDGLRA